MIIGLNFISINAETKERDDVSGNISVNSSPTIDSVEKRDFSIPGMKNVIGIGFSFNVRYDPDIGSITLNGEVLYAAEKMDNILKVWKEKKALDDSIALEVLNAIFRRSLIKAIELSSELRLPPPVTLPVVRKEDAQMKKK